MPQIDLNHLSATLAKLDSIQAIGRVCAVEQGVLQISGLHSHARHGDQVRITLKSGRELTGEVLKLEAGRLFALPEGTPEGVSLGDPVTLEEPAALSPCDAWIGRVIDPTGRPLDGRPLKRGDLSCQIKAAPVPASERALLGARLATGKAVFDTMLPVVEGQRIGLFAGSGVGKSSLLAHFAKHLEADVVVLALIGERGRELAEFVQHSLGEEGMRRTVIVTATSDQSPLMRRRCAWAAAAVAEHFRDQGKHVLFLADSLTRFAEAHREVAAATGELPTMRGYPPSLSHMLMALCERAGPGRVGSGAITAVFTVLVAGSDMDEPVADILRGVLDGHCVLDRDIAERGRYPAIDLLKSISRSLPRAANEEENTLIERARALLSTYEKAEIMINAGLYEKGRNSDLDAAVTVWEELDQFIAADVTQGIQASFNKLKLIIRKAQAAARVEAPAVRDARRLAPLARLPE
ncbi:FliI/YscN family ATPase [Lentibacter algarum]|uniref:FliI/YscN family ATPase n=1 Tax=Lentibacter algarum TaxID=576131 RepID=UPI001C06ADC8|nr:FliI/YscN family ATPase [Lentibacter algarum]MBU2981207.1 FliI/YscN family ATPase [Lentibacter algarum]